MNELPVPQRALLMPSRLQNSEFNDGANNLGTRYSSKPQSRRRRVFQKIPSLFTDEEPSLPVTNVRDSCNEEDIILRSVQRNPLSVPGQTIPVPYKRPNRHENKNSRGRTVEDQRRRPSLDSTSILKDSREVAHKARKNALTNKLQPMLGDGAKTFVLLCSGEAEVCSIILVPISDPANDTVVWREIRQAWCSRRAWWRNYVSLLGVKLHVDLVEVSIAGIDLPGPRGSKTAVEFAGRYREKDRHSEIRQLEHIIKEYREQEYPCPYNSSIGTTDCLQTCISYDIDVECPENVKYKAERQLQNLETQSLMNFAFANPALAYLNDFLEEETVVYGHGNSDILRMIEKLHCAKLRELKFCGILVEECWEVKSQYILFSLFMTFLFSTVIAAKFIFGDWGTAWNVGGFFLSLGSFFVLYARDQLQIKSHEQ